MNWSKNSWSLVLFGAYCCLLTWWVSDHIFFWDTVQLASKHAHWFYEQNFQHLLLPEAIDSGHPPIFGMYLAGCWKIFGKSLIVSHFSILPFLLGIVWLLHKIGTHYGNLSSAKYLILLVLIDPFFAGQSILVSPDIVLIFAFLGSLNAILQEKKWSIILFTVLLGTISMRGMMVTFSLYLWWVLSTFMQSSTVNNAESTSRTSSSGSTKALSFSAKNIWTTALQKLAYFLPAGMIAFAFLSYHYQLTGWIGYHPNSPWAGSFERVGFSGFLKNLALLGWRLLDFGRLFLWGSLLLILYKIWQISRLYSKVKSTASTWSAGSTFHSNYCRININKTKSLLSLLIILSLLLTPSLLLHKGLMSHRYLLPVTISITLFFYHLWVEYIPKGKLKKISYSVAFLGLLTGNLWVYPKQIAQGWDATLAHLPYYDLRGKMIQYIQQENIPFHEIGTVFPNIGPFELYDLEGQPTGFVKKDFSKNKYFLYSVVYNDVSDVELAELENNWMLVKAFKASGISVILYKNRSIN